MNTYSLNTSLPAIERCIRSQWLKDLESAATAVRHRGLKVTVAAAWDYPVHEAVVRRATSIGANLIVVETHGGRHIAPRLLRLPDWELLRHSPIPVLLVKTTSKYKRPAVLAAVDPAHSYSKPAKLDGAILQLSATFTEAFHGTLHAVHAYVPVPIGAFPDYSLSADTTARIEAQSAAEARRRFDRALSSFRVRKAHRYLLARTPSDAIEQTARDTRSAIVVMGAVSRSGIRRLMIGNTAETLIDRLTCDVLIVKPASFTSKVPQRRRGVRLAAIAAIPGM